MATVNFELRGSNPKKPHSINLIFRYGRKKTLKYPTGFKVLPEHWSISKQQVRNLAEILEKDKINNTLTKFITDITSVYTDLLASKGLINNDSLREGLESLKEQPNDSGYSEYVHLFLEKFIEDAPSIQIRKSSKKTEPLKEGSLKQYSNTLNKINDFNSHMNKKYKFKNLDLEFHSNFIKYLSENQRLSNNTIANRIKVIKRIAKVARMKGIEVNDEVFLNDFFKPTSDGIYHYLNEIQINKVFSLNLNKKERLDNVRDLFIIGLWTGLRISDFSRITTANLKEGFIEIQQTKTDDPVIIPIHRQVESIIEKNQGEFPYSISNQKFNEYVKEVCKLAGFKQKVKGTKRVRTKKGIRIKTANYPLYELISSHICRRSFATNHYGKLPNLVIMAITGHKTESAFLKYIKKTPKDHAKAMQEYWLKNKDQFGEPLKLKVVK